MASPVERLRRTGHDEVRFRQARLREDVGSGYTNQQMLDRVNDALEAEGLQPVAWETLKRDLITIRKDFQEAVAEDVLTRARQIDADLMLLQQRQTEDYLKRRETEKSTALDSDNIRKTIAERARWAGIAPEKNQNINLTFEMKVQDALSVNPEGERKVIPLLKDEGDGELLPAPKRADG